MAASPKLWPGPRISTTFSAPRGRQQRKLYPSDHDHVETITGIVPAIKHRTDIYPLLDGGGSYCFKLAHSEIPEQRQIAQKIQRAEGVPVSPHDPVYR
jgi:hypothetical protein